MSPSVVCKDNCSSAIKDPENVLNQNRNTIDMMAIRTLLVPAVLLFVLACVECQLTFSPDWGKRSLGVGSVSGGSGGSGSVSGTGAFFETQNGNCKTSNEMLLEIFRFVQAEAQLFLDCKHRE